MNGEIYQISQKNSKIWDGFDRRCKNYTLSYRVNNHDRLLAQKRFIEMLIKKI